MTVLSQPTVVGYSIGYLEGQSLSESSVSGSGQNSVAGSAISLTPDAGILMSPIELGQMTSQSSSDVQSRAQGNAKTTSKSQTLMPIIEDRASGTCPIEEQIFVLADDLASLPTQYGVISIGGRINMKFRALDAPDAVVSSSVFNKFLERLERENPYLVKMAQTDRDVPDLPKRDPPRDLDFLE